LGRTAGPTVTERTEAIKVRTGAIGAPRSARRLGLGAGLAACAVALYALAVGGCGGPTDRAQIRDTLNRLAHATANKDYRTLCERVFAPSIVQPALHIGLSCEQALTRGLGTVQAPRLVVRSIQMRGTTAFAVVHTSAANQPASNDTVQLVKIDGQWAVTALGAPAPAPARSAASKSERPMGPMQGALVPASR
jgi:hypothetical protein